VASPQQLADLLGDQAESRFLLRKRLDKATTTPPRTNGDATASRGTSIPRLSSGVASSCPTAYSRVHKPYAPLGIVLIVAVMSLVNFIQQRIQGKGN